MPRNKRTTDSKVVMQNAIKTLAANIRFSSVDKPIKTLAVVSSIPSEGKTTVSANLGAAIAESGSTVVVECDMRRRSMASALNAHGRYGLRSVLTGRHTLKEAIVPTRSTGLYFLDAEPGIPNPPDILQSERFRELIGGLSDVFGYVIVDTPPLGTFVDGAIISSLVDATVLVVRQDYTRRDEVVSSVNQLKQAGANVIGTVLNYCDATVSDKYYGYYQEKKPPAEALRPQADTRVAEPTEPVSGATSPTAVAASSDPDSTTVLLTNAGYSVKEKQSAGE